MKKSTLVVVLLALALGGFVYWHEFKRTPPAQVNTTNPVVFHFQPEDVTSITIAQPDTPPVVVDREGSGWQVAQPVQTRANTDTITSLLNDVTLAHSSRTLRPTGNELADYGLATPAATLDFKLKDGKTHTLKIGSLDFSGNSAYAQADGSKDVILVPQSVREDGTKTLADLRDKSVLGISSDEVQSFHLKTPSLDLDARRSVKNPEAWNIQKPLPMIGDSTAISQLLDNVSNAKLAKVVNETGPDLARYGLTRPAVSLEVNLGPGGQRSLDLGSKTGDQYYARDTSRNMVFLVPASLEKQLDQTLFALRDKRLLRELPDSFTRIDYHAGAFQFSCGVDKSGKWTMFAPAADKGKAVENWKVFDPLSSANALAILDSPSPALMAEVAHPVIEIDLTRKDGTKKIFRISKPVGKDVYVWVNDASGLYRIDKQTYDSLLFKTPADILQ
ncbi:MAG: DUF4340 domain-containing protein [Acidobacteriota bacterium]|nr:DUF4340 domain-containing protein [Acidobacteriota bacterium]